MNREEDEFGKKINKKKLLQTKRNSITQLERLGDIGVQMPARAFTMVLNIYQDKIAKHTRLSLGYRWHGFFRFLDSGEVIKTSAVLTAPPVT